MIGASNFATVAARQQGYEIQRVRKGRRLPLGSGTMGDVWPATHKETRELRVVKSVPKANTTRPVMQNEIQLMRSLCHPNIVRVLTRCSVGGKPCEVRELCQGGELFDFVAENGGLQSEPAMVVMRARLSLASEPLTHSAARLSL